MYTEKIPIEKLKNCRVCFNRYIEYQENNYEIEGNFCSQKCYERLIKDINSRLTKPEKLETRPKCITCGRRYEPLNEDDLTCKECKDFEKVCIIINCGNCGAVCSYKPENWIKITSKEELAKINQPIESEI